LLLVATVNKYVRLFISYRAARDHVTCISHGVVYVRILINFLVITIAMSDDDDISLCLAATVLSDAGGDVDARSCWVHALMEKSLLTDIKSNDFKAYRNSCRIRPDDYGDYDELLHPSPTRIQTVKGRLTRG